MRPFPSNIIVVLVWCGIIGSVSAQPFSFEKSYTANVLTFDGVPHMHPQSASNYSLVTGNAMIGTMGDAEVVAIRIDSNGTMINSLVMGKPMYHDVCMEVMERNREYYFTGYTRSTDTSASPLFTSFLIKTDSALNVLWQRNFIMSGNDFFVKAAGMTASGNFLFAGNNYDFASGNWHTFVMKTSTTGVILFCKMSDASFPIDPGFVCELKNHDILFSGSVTLGFEMVMPTVVRFDSLGNMRWAKVFDYDLGATQHSKFLFAKELASGNILFSGHSDYVGVANHGQMDYQVFKTDSAGTVAWMKTYGSNLVDWLYGADYNETTNEMLLAGTTESTTTSFDFYGYAVITDTNGTVTSSIVQGDTISVGRQLTLYNFSPLPSGNYILSGADYAGTAGLYASKLNNGATGFSSCHTYERPTVPFSATYPEYVYSVTPFPLDVVIYTNGLPFDYYSGVTDSLICYNDVTEIESPQGTSDFYIYPDPANTLITIGSTQDKFVSMEIFNALGVAALLPTPNSSLPTNIDISSLSPGIYFVKVTTEKGSAMKKLIVERNPR